MSKYIQYYTNIIETIIKEMKKTDKNLKNYLINISYIKKDEMEVHYEYNDSKIYPQAYIKIPIDIEDYFKNEDYIIPQEDKFLHSLFKEPKIIHNIIISVLHELGHLSQFSNEKTRREKNQITNYFSNCIEDIFIWDKKDDLEICNYWYRLKPQEIHADIYEYNYLLELNLSFEEIDNFLCNTKFEDYIIKISDENKNTVDHENKIIELRNKPVPNKYNQLKEFINKFNDKDKIKYLLNRLQVIYQIIEKRKIEGLSLYESMMHNMQCVFDMDEMSIFNYYKTISVCNIIIIINKINEEGKKLE